MTFFRRQFNIFLIFLFTFVLDILYSIISKSQDQDTGKIHDTRIPAVIYAFKIICSLVLAYFASHEIKTMSLLEKISDYFDDIWNFFDFFLIAVYIPVAILDITNDYTDALRILQCILVLMSFVKVCFFVRIYDGFSFLVSMLQGVFIDLQYFIAFYGIFLIHFGMQFLIIFGGQE